MKLLLDHDVPDDVARLLRHWGHEAILSREVLAITVADEEVFAYACRHQHVMLTCNRNDFLALAVRMASHSGLIILIRRRTRNLECARLFALLTAAEEAGIIGNVNFA